MLVGIYTRVSTQEQVNGYSLGEQEEKLKAYCMARGWTVANVYSDGGFSGGNINRPALQRMINDIKRKKIELVLVYKLDRLSRSQKDTLNLIEDVFNKHSISFVSVSENFDTSSPFGKATLGILACFSQLERETIRERMQLGAVARAKDGYFHGGGFIPIGYDYVDSELIINEYEAMQVREVCDLFLKGYPINRIRKIMASKYTNKYGNWYSASSVRSCLTTPLYHGKITYAGEQYDGRHEPIISVETYNKIQERFKELDSTNELKKGSRKTPFQPTQLLGGIIWCGNCGARCFTHHISARKTSNHKGWDYYSCYSRLKPSKKMIVDPDCKMKHWPVEQANKIVIDEIIKLQFNDDYLKEVSQSNAEETSTEDKRLIIEKRIDEISAQLDKIMDMYQLGSVPLDKIAERIEKLNNERNGLESELFALNEEAENKKTPLAETRDILKKAKSIFDGDDKDAKRMLINSLIERIELYEDRLKIYWAF